jgi:Na+/H+-dicarboxylate symporter
MTVLPLVMALLVNGVLQAVSHGKAGGGITGRIVRAFGSLYVLGVVAGTAVAFAALAWFPIPEAARTALAGGILTEAVPTPDAGKAILGIIPANVFAAAAEGAQLPLVVFALLLGAAMARLELGERDPLERLFQALARAMFVIVEWVLLAAPLGVCALIASTTLATGTAAIGGLLHYMAFIIAVHAAMVLLAYPVAAYGGRIPLGRFAREALPAQVVAAGTRSSLASLPAMIDATDRMAVPQAISAISLPLAVSVFRFCGPASAIAISLYGAAIYGIAIDPSLLVLAMGVCILNEFGSVGLPNQTTFFANIAPPLAVLGVPIEYAALLVALDTLPDVFLTTANASMDMAATTVIAKSAGQDVAEATR